MANPNQLDWNHYQDIQVTDVQDKNLFDQYMKFGNYSQALSLLKKDNLNGKAFIAETITTIINGLLDLENLFNNNVNLFLTDLSLKYMEMINNLSKKGEWDETTQYTPYNFVFYNEQIYMNIAESPIGTLPTNSQYWLLLGLRGNKGVPGVDLTLRYNWRDDVNYPINSLVVYNGNIYVALQQNINITPGTENSNWLLFLVVNKGKINVGINEPENINLNTIWFKTEIDPLNSDNINPIIGEFFRYDSNGNWESMYPSVVFSWIENIELYSRKNIKFPIQIEVSDWIFENNKYTFTYNSNDIESNSFVEISPYYIFNTEQWGLYSTFELLINDGSFVIYTTLIPNIDIIINISIQ